jgi:hypothetical protein
MPARELHLFILWSAARHAERRIIDYLKTHCTVVASLEVEWSAELFSQNLTRFYGQDLPAGSHKEAHCGTGPFLLVVVQDMKPEYAERQTSKGPGYVNTSTFDSKKLFREWTGGGHKIHATNNPQETSHDLTLLTGLNPQDFLKKYPVGSTGSLKQDLSGARGWPHVRDLLYVLNACTPYVVLRNFEPLPDEYNLAGHGDIDFLVDDLSRMVFVSNAKKVHAENYRVHYTAQISGEPVPMDFRFVGDGYMDANWERDLLRNRVWCEKGFYAPPPEAYFYSLLYHAAVHKRAVADDYRVRLAKLGSELGITDATETNLGESLYRRGLIDLYLLRNGYRYVRPTDKTVYFNPELAGAAELAQQVKLLRKELKAALMREQELKENLHRVLGSQSWRITAPIRRVRSLFTSWAKGSAGQKLAAPTQGESF